MRFRWQKSEGGGVTPLEVFKETISNFLSFLSLTCTLHTSWLARRRYNKYIWILMFIGTVSRLIYIHIYKGFEGYIMRYGQEMVCLWVCVSVCEGEYVWAWMFCLVFCQPFPVQVVCMNYDDLSRVRFWTNYSVPFMGIPTNRTRFNGSRYQPCLV